MMLIFDFDGVLFNSNDEAVVTAFNAVTGELRTSLAQLPRNLIRRFRINRFHAQGADDIFTLMAWCLKADSADPDRRLTPAEYAAIGEEAALPPRDRRRDRFFEARRRFVETDREAWLALGAPYQPLWDALRERGGGRMVLITSKNRTAVRDLCRHFGLWILEENIYSGDAGATKTENLRRVHERFRRDAYRFVDDNIKNLNALDRDFNQGRTFLRLALASWGYVGPEDRGRALEAGYAVYAQEDLIALLDRELPQDPFRG